MTSNDNPFARKDKPIFMETSLLSVERESKYLFFINDLLLFVLNNINLKQYHTALGCIDSLHQK